MEATTVHEPFETYLEGYKKLIIKVAGANCSDYEDRKDLTQEITLHSDWLVYSTLGSIVITLVIVYFLKKFPAND